MHEVELILELLKIAAILCVGVGTIITVVRTAAHLVVNVTTAVTEFKFIGKVQSEEILELKVTVKEIGKVITQMAVEKARLDTQSERITRVERLVDEIRRGEGYILPLPARLGQGPA